MHPPDLIEALLPVAEALEDLGVAYYIGGSVASSAFGVARSTADIDLIADLTTKEVDAFVSALQGSYYLDGDSIRSAIRQRSSFNVLHLESMIKVDVFIPQRRPFDLSVRARSVRQALSDRTTDRKFQLAAPEDLVLSKLEWFEMGGRASEKQWGDVLGILRIQGGALDLKYLRRWAEKLEVQSSLEKALRETGLA